ncbi:hypothetical protein GCM10027456_74710 [Kineosporia babensis]
MEAKGQAGIAIVGMAVLYPKAVDLQSYWANIVSGRDAITEVGPERWDPEFYAGREGRGEYPVDRVYARRGGFLDADTAVPATRYGIPPVAVSGIEPDQMIALDVAARAIADAGGEDRLPDRDRVGVVLGRGGYVTPAAIRFSERVRGSSQLVATLSQILPDLDQRSLDLVRQTYQEALGPFAPESAIGLVSNLAASRLANRLDLRGPAYTVDGACASSLIAVDQAVSLLLAGRCDTVLAGGTHHVHDISFWSVFAQMRALSQRETIRPFDAEADGTLIGEGTGVVVLRRLDDAIEAGDRIYAVIRGTGVASDGRTSSLMNPDPAGQARAVRQAWQTAGLDTRAPGSVGLIEAHGTATRAGDSAEIRSMIDVFGTEGDPVAIGTVKSMIGHTMPAAGVAGLVKAALAVHHGVLPPTLNVSTPHPELAGSRFEPLAQAREWPSRADGTPRRAGVNAFGFGGINAHVVIEEPAPPARSRRVTSFGGSGDRVLRIAARTKAELARMLDCDDAVVRARLGSEPDVGPVRLAVAGPDARRLALARRAVQTGEPWRDGADVWFTPHPCSATPGVWPSSSRAWTRISSLDWRICRPGSGSLPRRPTPKTQ